MTHGSLFSGIGGFDLAAQWMGWDNIFHVERDSFCQRVLAHHFPKSKPYADITKFDATPFRGRVSVLSGGFPCQPFSEAGKRKGTEDERFLWHEMLRVIRECAPTWVVAENVRGLVNWNGGVQFESCCTDLEAAGYSVQPFILPACSVNAPHRRDRVWFVAQYTDGTTQGQVGQVPGGQDSECDGVRRVAPDSDDSRGRARFGQVPGADGEVSEWYDHAEFGYSGPAASTDTDGTGGGDSVRTNGVRSEEIGRRLPESESRQTGGDGYATHADEYGSLWAGCEDGGAESEGIEASERFPDREHPEDGYPGYRTVRGWEEFPTESPICGRDDGFSQGLDGISVSKWKKESIKAYGNAIVPQVALQIFRSISMDK